MSDARDRWWFAPKRFGYGAGLPIAWQGWALLGGYGAVILLLWLTLRDSHPVMAVALAIIATAPVLVLGARHTRGGWRWRWGWDD